MLFEEDVEIKKLIFAFIYLLLVAPCIAENTPNNHDATSAGYVPNQIIVKFRRNITNTIEMRLAEGTSLSELKLSDSLDKLHKKYRVIETEPIFKNFRKQRQRIETLRQKDKALLTKREKRILRRLRRAPKDARVPELDRIYRIEVELEPGQSLEEAVAAYNNDPGVEYAELNYVVSINTAPNDTFYPIQWPLNNTGQMYPESGKYNSPPGTTDCDIDAPEAWDIYTGNSEVIVAVIDTGVDYNHRDLDDNMWTDSNGCYGYDYINDDSDPMDDNGHGTHCAGIIAAEGNNGLDITGVCWNAKIMALKFLSAGGSGSYADATEAFYYAVNNGADVISNSWGKDSYSQTMQDAIDYAHSQGIVVVAAAGNDNQYCFPHYPASMEPVISVAATNSNDEKAPNSNYGDWIDISAPGIDILSLRANGTSMGTPYDNYTTIVSGTSMACPLVSGVLGLILSNYPSVSAEEITARLLETTVDISGQNPYYENLLGSGRVNAYKALRSNFEGIVELDQDSYSCSDVVTIEVRDFDLCGSGSQQVTITTDGGDSETATLIEDANRPWVFVGTTSTSGAPIVVDDGYLQVVHGQTITAVHNDPNYGDTGPSPVQATAIVDCEGALIFNVVVHNVTSSGARIRFHTNEMTTAVVKCGPNCSAPYCIVSEDLQPSKGHDIYLPNLIREKQYFFIIEANDLVGNQSMNDNASQCYSFTTNAIPTGLHVPVEYPTIQAAINTAIEGQTILVADGVYTGNGNRDIRFKGKAITVQSENGPENCIIDCQASTSDNHYGFHFNSGEGPNSILDGFTITGAHNSDLYTNGGAGIVCDRANNNPTIRNCIIRGNIACVGGGIACIKSHPTIINCTIIDNTASYDAGGGIYCHDRSNPLIIGCYIRGNKAKYKGGGIHCNGNATITNCVIVSNNGGLIGGGGISCLNQSSPNITNCTISGNSGAGIRCRYECNPGIISCILWANGTEEIYRYHSSPQITYSDLQGGWSGTGNINVNPHFADFANGDFHLKSEVGRWNPNSQRWIVDANTSLCIDAGAPNSDWAAELWPHGKRINMGAFGGTSQASMSLSDAGNIADLNNNGSVDYIDLRMFTNEWLYQEVLLSEDLDRNGFVNGIDFAIFANEWLWGK